jgi:hypothetical protein
MNDPRKRSLLCKKCVKALNLKPCPLVVELLKCKYCGSLVLSAHGKAHCPKGCPGNYLVEATWEIEDNAAPRQTGGPLR